MPMLASAAVSPLAALGQGWVFEPKLDGWRILGSSQGFFTRGGQQVFVPQIGRPAEGWVLDGELLAVNADGTASFEKIAKARVEDGTTLVWHIFDVLQVPSPMPGHPPIDTQCLPLSVRRSILSESYVNAMSSHQTWGSRGWKLVDQVLDGPGLYEQVIGEGGEGIVAKQNVSRYLPGRSPNWVKFKEVESHSYIVTGHVPGDGSRISTFRALELSAPDLSGELGSVGRVGSGFSRGNLSHIRRLLDGGVPFVIDVRHQGFTDSGKLRHPVFVRVRHDLTPDQI